MAADAATIAASGLFCCYSAVAEWAETDLAVLTVAAVAPMVLASLAETITIAVAGLSGFYYFPASATAITPAVVTATTAAAVNYVRQAVPTLPVFPR